MKIQLCGLFQIKMFFLDMNILDDCSVRVYFYGKQECNSG